MSEFHALFRISGPLLDHDEITVTSAGLQVGRSGDNDLALQHSEISRKHMRFYPHESGFAVEDLKSSNGVWVNDVRIRTQTPHPLKPGDVVRAGPYLFTFERIIEVGAPEVKPAVSAAEVVVPPPVEPSPATPEPPPPPPHEFAEKVTSEKEKAQPEAKPAEPSLPPLRELPRRDEPPQIKREERVTPSAFIPRTDGDGLGQIEAIPPYGTLPPLETNGHLTYPFGVPTDVSNWLKYLPAIYSDDEFMGRYLLIFESIFSPISWIVDNFDMYLSPEVAPSEWLRWMASWFDVLIVPDLPLDRQRALVEQLGWLFFRRGTRAGLERLLTLYYGVKPEIIEDGDMHFTVRMPLSESSVKLERDIVDRLIMAHKPAHAAYTLEVT